MKQETKTKTTNLQSTEVKSWIKDLLNNMPLLKWVKKYSADKLFEDNEIAKKYGVTTNDRSISVSDETLTKIIVTNSEYKDKEVVRYNLKQIAEVTDLLGKEGELIIRESEDNEMIIQMNNTHIIVCPLGKSD